MQDTTLAHQHLGQLPQDVREAIDANARNKLFFTVSPTDATRLVRHVAPFFDDRDLSGRCAFEITCRTVHHGHDHPPFTLDALALPPAVAGRAQALRAAARTVSGLARTQRDQTAQRRKIEATPGIDQLRTNPPHQRRSPGTPPSTSPANPGGSLSLPGERPTPPATTPQLTPPEEDPCPEPDWL